MDKRKITIDELKVLRDVVSDTQTKEILTKTLDIFNKYSNFKYISKNFKKDLEEIGFVYVSKYVYKIGDRIFETKSKEIDIINGNILRIGIGRVKKYNPEWLEIELKL
jgi:hypothetical protein